MAERVRSRPARGWPESEPEGVRWYIAPTDEGRLIHEREWLHENGTTWTGAEADRVSCRLACELLPEGVIYRMIALEREVTGESAVDPVDAWQVRVTEAVRPRA